MYPIKKFRVTGFETTVRFLTSATPLDVLRQKILGINNRDWIGFAGEYPFIARVHYLTHPVFLVVAEVPDLSNKILSAISIRKKHCQAHKLLRYASPVTSFVKC